MEIKIQDLRIGNNVFFDGKVQEISSIHSDNTIRLKENKDSKCHGCYKVNRIKPIQLTEEVLLKCGAKETESYTYEFTQIGKDIDLCVKFCEYDICVTIWQGDPIYLRYDFVDFYLHTLQNLILALIGEELTYNHSQ